MLLGPEAPGSFLLTLFACRWHGDLCYSTHPLGLSAKRTTAARLIPNASTLLKHSRTLLKHPQTLPKSEPVVKQAYTTPGCRLTMIKAKHRGTQISDCFSFFFTMLLSN